MTDVQSTVEPLNKNQHGAPASFLDCFPASTHGDVYGDNVHHVCCHSQHTDDNIQEVVPPATLSMREHHFCTQCLSYYLSK